MLTHQTPAGLRSAVRLVAILNLAYFGIEFAVGVAIGSVSLFADSIDFLEDASVNFLILVALGWSTPGRARLGMALAGILLIPGLATAWTAWRKFLIPVPPAPVPLSLAGAARQAPVHSHQQFCAHHDLCLSGEFKLLGARPAPDTQPKS